jgi:O-methyltransferase
MMLARLLSECAPKQGNQLHLFDTFEGMPETDARLDIHSDGDFADCSIERVNERVQKFGTGLVDLHRGLIPETFTGLEAHRIAFAHIDVDIFRSVQDCCEFIYPRLLPGGFMIFDDYGFLSCPGARKAVDEYFTHRPEFPLVLPTGQALVFKSP